MSMKISVILLFLLYIGILIFAKKVFDHHHAYNRRSEITHMNLVTCNGTAKVWCSISSIFTCRIFETLRSIVLAITRKKLSNKFLIYEAEWKKFFCGGILFYIVCVFGRNIDNGFYYS